ncbi:MAB_1171c family putative transporter [Nocardia anaemiae]|uniref:MAB_1171c family putative transporter n=1 Tax=Nocardia anaemiae TaxID=263910 RepID=UPI0007A53F7E|nr:MAB_1171c family putative transporter [Nocardia anaemiae]
MTPDPILLILLTAFACGAVLAIKARDIIRDPDNGMHRASALFAAAILATMMLWLESDAIDQHTHVRTVGILLSDITAMLAVCASQIWFVYLTTRTEIARRRSPLCYAGFVVVVGAVVLLFAAFPPASANDARYRYLFICYVGVSAVAAVVFGFRYAALTAKPWLRIGFRVIALGGIAVIARLAFLGYVLVAADLGHAPRPVYATVDGLLTVAGLLIVITGMALPSGGEFLGALLHAYRCHRAERQLSALSGHLTSATGTTCVVPLPASREWNPLRDAEFRLCRRVIDIRDAQLALRGYADPRARQLAADRYDALGLPDHERGPMIEAAVIASAITAKQAGHPPRHNTTMTLSTEQGGTDTLLDEARWLGRVSRALRSAEIVRRNAEV